jgi:hypothetical protein
VRVVQSALAADTVHQILHGYVIELKSRSRYANVSVTNEFTIDKSSSGVHILWPQLIEPDGNAGSDASVDATMVLRWSEVQGALVREMAQVLVGRYRGPETQLGTWRISEAFPTVSDCFAEFPPDGCFAGDYRYGAFWEKSGGRLRFFVPRNGVPTGAPMGFDRLRAIAAYIDVTP